VDKILSVYLKTQIYSVIGIIILGSLLHSMYFWLGKFIVIGLLMPVNESFWEHMKLYFLPIVIFGFVERHYIKGDIGTFWLVKFFEIIFAIVINIIIFYGYKSLTGTNYFLIDISSYIVSIVFAKMLGNIIIRKLGKINIKPSVGIIAIVLLSIMFVCFTIFPPHLPMFMDSNNGTYGLQ